MNGFIEKYKANEKRLDNDALAKIAADMEAGGYDANPEQWDQLNAAVEALPPEDDGVKGNAEDGVADNGRLVSKDPAGTGSNPIGYPGTDQDQDVPGKASKVVPGVKPLKKAGE